MAEITKAVERAPLRPQRESPRIFAAAVCAVRQLTPHMRRLTLTAAEFASFVPMGPDEYFGLLLPQDEDAELVLPDIDAPEAIRAAVAAIPDDIRPDLRWYTLRNHRPESEEIDIDFVVHGDEGPGTRFASRARIGSVLGVRESTSIYAEFDDVRTQVLVGDESSLPAIARILEMRSVADTRVFIEIADADERQEIGAASSIEWIEREGRRPGERLRDAVAAAALPEQLDYVWICGESGAVQELRRHFVGERGVAKSRITFSGYWRLGEARG